MTDVESPSPIEVFARRYHILIEQGHVPGFSELVEPVTAQDLMQAVNEATLVSDDAAWAHGSLQTYIHSQQIYDRNVSLDLITK